MNFATAFEKGVRKRTRENGRGGVAPLAGMGAAAEAQAAKAAIMVELRTNIAIAGSAGKCCTIQTLCSLEWIQQVHLNAPRL